MASKKGGYTRLASIPAKYVFDALVAGEEFLRLNPRLVRGVPKIAISSLRLKTYTKGSCCVNCGREIHFFAWEKDKKGTTNYHLNAYHLGEDGKEMMVTSDHIIPYSLTRDNSLENRQVMCAKCNTLKSHFSTVEEGVLFFRMTRTKKYIRSEENKIRRLSESLFSLLKLRDVGLAEKIQRIEFEILRSELRLIGFEQEQIQLISSKSVSEEEIPV